MTGRFWLLIIGCLLLFNSCKLAKHQLVSEYQLVKNTIQVEESNRSRFVIGDLESNIRQKPNKKLLGLARTSVWFYRIGSGKKDNGFNRFLRYKLGEFPVILDSTQIEASIRGMKNTLKNVGFYYPNIQYSVQPYKLFWLFPMKQRMHVRYHVKLRKPYIIYSLDNESADAEVFRIINQQNSHRIIRLGNELNREKLFKEQNRLTELLKNNGYFDFNKDQIHYDMDTAIGNFKTSISVIIPLKEEQKAYEKYRIGKITIQLESVDNNEHIDTLYFPEFIYITGKNAIRPEVLTRLLFLKKGDLFSQLNLTATYNKLVDLQVFRQISINPNTHHDSSGAVVDFFIHLFPGNKYDFTIEPQAITSDQNNTLGSTASNRNFGTAVTTQLNNRNAFHGAEMLQIKVRNAFEAQRGQGISSTPFFNSNEQSISASISFPRLLLLKSFERKLIQFSSRTNISTALIYESNIQYKRQVLTAGLNYQINKKLYTYSFAPFEISYIKTAFASQDLEDRSKNDILLQNIFANNLITDSRFGFIYSDKPLSYDGSYFYLRWDVLEIAGNTLSLLNSIFGANSNQHAVLGVKYYQYAKSYFDIRYNQTLDVNNSFHYRIASGYALPYGNTPDFVPFEKRFFIGGANSLRAFRPRAIGPGTYNVANQIDRSGEVKIEMNFEYRFNIYKHILEGAVFTDAGNVWIAKPDATRPGADFRLSNFYNEMAIGTGIGARFNMSFFIFRLDAAIPVRDPRNTDSHGWVLRDYIKQDQFWSNTILNFGVGYPF